MVVFCVFEKRQMFFYFLFISMAIVFLQRNHVFVLILILIFYKWIKQCENHKESGRVL